MKLIVGLGNPGERYRNTRHNMGFAFIDEVAATLEVKAFKSGFDALYAKVRAGGDELILCKPQTFMNLSGEAVKKIADYYRIEITDLLVVSDDLALEPGRIRLRSKGSSGGQKGLQNIIDTLGTDDFKRIRIGIGEPDRSVVDYVLSAPEKDEQEMIDKALQKAVDAFFYALSDGFEKATSKYNSKL